MFITFFSLEHLMDNVAPEQNDNYPIAHLYNNNICTVEDFCFFQTKTKFQMKIEEVKFIAGYWHAFILANPLQWTIDLDFSCQFSNEKSFFDESLYLKESRYDTKFTILSSKLVKVVVRFVDKTQLVHWRQAVGSEHHLKID